MIGGARSGKSAFAQAEVEASGLEPVFVATAQAFHEGMYDDEMRARILRHVAARGARWRTIEAPLDLVLVLDREAAPGRMLLVDCLTLWLSNLMLRGDDVAAASAGLVAAIGALRGPAAFVSNEVGGGIVPETALGRRFRDAQGRLNQDVAAACTYAVLVSAGLPIMLKPAPSPRFDF